MSHVGRSIEPRKLIDELVPSAQHGQLLGLLGTSFDLDPEFLETDFLPSLVGVRAWDDRRWSARVGVERELARTYSVTVLMDGRRYRGRPRSLRVELVPATGPEGQVLHAKVMLLVYEAAVRLIVGSANLTEPGYRLNREVAVALTGSKQRRAEAAVVLSALAPMADRLVDWWTAGATRVVDMARSKLKQWATPPPSDDEAFVWGGGESPLWRQVLERWPVGERVRQITIVSPFWSEATPGSPIDRLMDELSSRGLLHPGAALRLVTSAAPETQSTYRPMLPSSYALAAGRWPVHAVAAAASPVVEANEAGGRDDLRRERQLHAKVFLMRGDRTRLAYFGSANFTNRGWGFIRDARRANIEAGVLLRRTGASGVALDSLVPLTIGQDVRLGEAAAGRLAPLPQDEAIAPWPSFLRDVRLVVSTDGIDQLELEVRVCVGKVAGPFSVAVPNIGIVLSASPAAQEPGRAAAQCVEVVSPDSATSGPVRETNRVRLTSATLRSLLKEQVVEINWWQVPEAAEIPINVDLHARDRLPFGDLEQRPSEGMLVAYYQGRISFEDIFPADAGQANKKQQDGDSALPSEVDTSRIQSYQVREFVEALQGIRDDLRAAASTGSEPAMRLALLGAVSPVALAAEITAAAQAGQRSPVAAGFQLIELLAILAACSGLARGDDAESSPWQPLLAEAQTRCRAMFDRLKATHRADLRDAAFQAYEATVAAMHRLNPSSPMPEGKP